MPSPKHILFINEFFHPDFCASAMVLEDRLPRIARLRTEWRITVIAGNRAWDDPAVVYPETEEFQGVQIVRVPRPAVGGRGLVRRALGFAAFGRNAIRAAMRLPQVDLVLATTAPPQGGRIARKIARRHGCPYIYAVLDLYPDIAASLKKLPANSFRYRCWLGADTQAMEGAARVVSISTPITERIAGTRGIPPERLATIHDGFDPARLDMGRAGVSPALQAKGPQSPNSFRQLYNPDDRFVVQYAGNMGLSHPFEAIMDVSEGLRASDPEILFQFVGDGPRRPYIKKRLGPNARLIDYQPAERLGEVLAAADVCLVSQQLDLFDQALPYKIYGILAAGKPTLFMGNERSEIAEWLNRSGAGTVIHPFSPAPLIAHLRELKRHPELALAQGRAARRLFEERFHADGAARAWADLLAGAL